MAVNVMIVDDHSMVREGLMHLLELEGEFKVVGEAGDGLEFLKKLKKVKPKPDILLLDINMPNMNGLEVLRALKEKKSKLKVLVLTVHNEVEYLLKAIDIGVNGYILKDSKLEELKEAINTVMSGEDYIQPSMIPALNRRKIDMTLDNAKIINLTNREMDVLKLIAIGLNNREIARQLEISESTVKNHISSLFKKIGVTDRTQAAVFAIRNNIITL